MIDVAAAENFILALGSGFTFQTFDDSEAKRRELARVVNAQTLNEALPTLTKLNDAGAGVFVTVNQTDGRGRQISNITGVRALFVDADDVVMPAAGHLEPSIIVERDQRHCHWYWLLKEPVALDAETFKSAQKRLAAHYGTDPKICDLPRVMRVPGFMHRKKEPVLVRLKKCDANLRYGFEQILETIPQLNEAKTLVVKLPQVIGRADYDRAALYVSKVPSASQPGRNNALFELGFYVLERFRLSEGELTSLLTPWGFCCQPALSESEIKATLRSCYRKAERDGKIGSKWEASRSGSGRPAPDYAGEIETQIDVDDTPHDLLPSLPRVPAGDDAAWFDSQFYDDLSEVCRLQGQGTKGDAAALKLFAQLAARLPGVSVVTKNRVKKAVCDKLELGSREYDKALIEAATIQKKNSDSGLISMAGNFKAALWSDRTPRRWIFWRGEWYEWTAIDNCYRPISNKWVESRVSLWLSQNGVEPTVGALADFLNALRAVCILSDETRDGTFIDGRKTDPEAQYFSFKNGILNLCRRDLPLIAPTPEFFTLNAAPFEFDPAATCPKWLQVTQEWHPLDETGAAYQALQDWFGYCYVRGNPHKIVSINIGGGNDGKSVKSNVLRALIGEKNCSAVGLECFDPKQTFGLQPLLGKMLNQIGDANQVERVAEGTLKALTGNDPYTFQRKGIAAVTEAWPGKIEINANATPYWRDRSNALYNRMLILHWRTIPPEKVNSNLTNELMAELSGIFNWAMEGFDRIRKQPFNRVGQVAAWVEEARNDTQAELDFFDTYIGVDSEPGTLKKLYRHDLMTAYRNYCDSANVKAFCNEQTLGRQLREWLRRRFVESALAEDRQRGFFEKLDGRDGIGRDSNCKRLRFYRGLYLLGEETSLLAG